MSGKLTKAEELAKAVREYRDARNIGHPGFDRPNIAKYFALMLEALASYEAVPAHPAAGEDEQRAKDSAHFHAWYLSGTAKPPRYPDPEYIWHAAMAQGRKQSAEQLAEVQARADDLSAARWADAIASMNRLDELRARVDDLEKLREGDFELTRALAKDAGIEITASDKMPGRQWEEFHKGVLALSTRAKELQELVEGYKRTANFYRDLGITILDAKYLDPACHQGCQSLVWQSRIAALKGNRWISTAERMPTESDGVIMAGSYRGGKWTTSTAHRGGNWPHWFDDDRTHWCSLPAPPEPKPVADQSEEKKNP